MRGTKKRATWARTIAVTCTACALARGVAAQQVDPQPLKLAPPPGFGAAFAVPTTNDRAGRVVVEVFLDGRGPHRFIVDTGANRSVISQRLAAGLGLSPDGALADTVVHGITGSAVMPQVSVESLTVGTLQLEAPRLAVLPDLVFGDAEGILGIDALQAARIDIDFDHDEVVVGPSGVSRADGRLVVRAKVRKGGLMLVPGKVGRVRVQAIVDTGAERTLGNEALRQALELRADSEIDGTVTTVVGATAQSVPGLVFSAPTVWIGGAKLRDLPVTFGNFHVFDVWSLRDEPALVIGMDVLGWLPQVTIDYPRRELQLRLPAMRLPRTTS